MYISKSVIDSIYPDKDEFLQLYDENEYHTFKLEWYLSWPSIFIPCILIGMGIYHDHFNYSLHGLSVAFLLVGCGMLCIFYVAKRQITNQKKGDG